MRTHYITEYSPFASWDNKSEGENDMSYKYEKVENNIYRYKTKTGKIRYRVKISIDYIPFDKSGLANITAARAFIKQATADVYNGEYSKYKPKEYTLGEYFEYYLKKKTQPKGIENKPDWNKTTKATSESIFKIHILPVFGETKLKDITRMDFEAFSDSLVNEKGLRTHSAITIISRLSSMMDHAVENEIIDRNRCSNIQPPASKNDKINKELPYEDFKKLSDYYDNRHVALKVRFWILSLGLRSAELSGLKVNDVEFLPNKENPLQAKITVDKSRPRYYSETGKGTKTGKKRVIYTTQKIALVLSEYIAWLKDTYAKSDKVLHTNNWLLVNVKTKKPVAYSTIYSELRSTGQKLGIKVSPHMLRHHFATQAKLDGIDIRYIADVLGQQSLATTEGYTHGEEESAKIVSQKVTFI